MGAFPRLPDGREYYLERSDKTGETYLKVRGTDLKVGDDLIFLSAPHRLTDFKPYKHPRSEEYGWGPGWQTAYARTTEIKITDRTWGITIEPGGWYEVSKALLTEAALCSLALATMN